MTITFTSSNEFNWNILIAVVAVVGFLFSMIISLITLKRTKDIALFDKRYALIQYFYQHFAGNWLEIPNENKKREFLVNNCNISLLFDDCEQFFYLAESLFNYYSKGDSLPDYTKKYNKSNIEEAFFEHAMNGLLILKKYLYSSKHAKKKIKMIKKLNG